MTITDRSQGFSALAGDDGAMGPGHGMGEAMALSADEAALHPLMVWWQMLFAMSMLNRYHPAGWTQMIDLDSSPRVVAIEHLPDVASRQETRSVRLANHGSRCCASRLGP